MADLAAREEGWPLAGVYEALGGRRGVDAVVDEVVEEDSGSELSEEDELGNDGGVESSDMQGGGEEIHVVTEGVWGMEVGRRSRAWRIVMSRSEDEDEVRGESVAGPSVVALGKQRVHDDSEDEDKSGPSKRPQSDGGGDESRGGVEGRMVLCAPAPSLPLFSCVLPPLSGYLDKAASLSLQNARLEATNSITAGAGSCFLWEKGKRNMLCNIHDTFP
ncbi:hypothetical protein C0992_010511 [Termitomyces sp. T32_za158]|nr:hypothetical protein C0992_010511 [Termitomyces sp. T32_za158]